MRFESNSLTRKLSKAWCLSINSDDELWLCRMIMGERSAKGADDINELSAMLWAMVNRYLLHPGLATWLKLATRHNIEGSDFIKMVRLFSQPINPRWSSGGDLAYKYRDHPLGTRARLKRRARIQALTVDDIPKDVVDVVHAFSLGLLGPPADFFLVPNSRISNWASYKNVDKHNPGGVWIDGNYFLEDKALRAGVVVVNPWA